MECVEMWTRQTRGRGEWRKGHGFWNPCVVATLDCDSVAGVRRQRYQRVKNVDPIRRAGGENAAFDVGVTVAADVAVGGVVVVVVAVADVEDDVEKVPSHLVAEYVYGEYVGTDQLKKQKRENCLGGPLAPVHCVYLGYDFRA